MKPRVSRIGQWQTNSSGDAGDGNQIRVGFVQDIDTVFNPTIANSDQVISLPLVVDADTIFNSSIGMNLALPLVVDADTIFNPSIGMNLALPLTVDADTIFDPVITAGALGVAVPLTVDADTIFDPILDPGAVGITVPLVVDVDIVNNPAVTALGQPLTVPLTVDADTIFDPTLAPGVVEITPPLTVDADTIFDPTLAPGAVEITPPLTADADTIFDPTLAPGAVGITVPLVVDADTFFNPTIDPGAVEITPPLVVDLDSIPNPTVEGAGFLPTDIAGLIVWLDASDAASITEVDGRVSQWDDLSAAGNDVSQGTAGNRPVTATVNTNDSIQFTLAQQEQLLATLGAAIPSVPLTVVMVVTPLTGNNNDNPLTLEEASGIRVALQQDNTTLSNFWNNTTPDVTINAATVMANGDTSWHITRMRSSDDGDSDTLANSGQEDTDATTHNVEPDFDEISLGTRVAGGNAWSGHLHEIIIWDSYISDADRADVDAYLDAKWNITA